VRRGGRASTRCRGRQHAIDQEVRRDNAGIPRRSPVDTDQQSDGALYRLVKVQFILVQPYGSCQLASEPLRRLRVECVYFEVRACSRMEWDQCGIDKAAETEFGAFGYVALPVRGRID
jgi:hypothetical protein